MKRRIVAVFCIMVLMMGLCVTKASASSVFFLSMNDTLPELTPQTTPIQSGGWVYVPVTIFNSSVTGITFNLHYGVTNSDDELIVYNLSGKVLTFHLNTGTCSVNTGTIPTPGKAFYQNGQYYVPAYAICQYFGLTYSLNNTDYGQLLRIKNSSAVLSDWQFITSAASLMKSRLNAMNPPAPPAQSPSASPSGGGSTSSSGDSHSSAPNPTPPAASVTPVPSTTEPVQTRKFPASFAIRLNEWADISGILNAMASSSARAVLFVPSDQVMSYAQQIRLATVRGHAVGLIPTGSTEEEKLASVRAGEEAVASILHREVWFVLGYDSALANAGYLCWQPNCAIEAGVGGNDAANMVQNDAPQQGRCHVLLSAKMSENAAAAMLSRLKSDGVSFQSSIETDY